METFFTNQQVSIYSDLMHEKIQNPVDQGNKKNERTAAIRIERKQILNSNPNSSELIY